MTYTARIVDHELSELLHALPAVLLEGPKGVGKTRTAEQRAATIVQLDDPAQRALALANPAQAIAGARPVLLDEWQHAPAVWDAVRRAVDRSREPGAFLLTGSAAPVRPATHSGAGRIVSLRMRPMSLAERGIETPTVSLRKLLGNRRASLKGRTSQSLVHYTSEIVQSGFPAIRTWGGRALRAQLDSYLARVVDRDFAEIGRPLRRPETLRRWMTAYAAATSTTASIETIRDAATSGEADKPAKSTVIEYREVLERLWIVDPVPAWMPTRNALSALLQAPKHQLADPALAARLLGATEDSLLRGHTPTRVMERPSSDKSRPRDGAMLGRLFESLVTLDVRVYAQANEARVGHLRTFNGRHEVDLIVERDDGKILAIEVKLGGVVTDDDVKHLHWLKAEIGRDLLDAVVITTGPDAYRRTDGIGVIPAALLGP
jgi:predicted AAA+ superfamily ATPase